MAVSRLIILAFVAVAAGWGQFSGSYDLSQASLEDLMKIPVTSVSKKEQKLSKVPAAVFVITQEDIRRSGATNIPDLLRLAPGVDVARVDANRWAISIRGFSDQHANKVLVLVDGMSVYDPTVTGVFWDMVDVPLEDIDRIEIIRGPGSTMWGANAVNGVINIITKKASATRGGLISAGAGNEDQAQGLVQYGGDMGQEVSYRVFGKYFDVANAVFPDGQQAADGWQGGHAGFRADWDLTPEDGLTVEGDFLRADESQTLTTMFYNTLPLLETYNNAIRSTVGDALARWTHTLANGSQMSLQLYERYCGRLDQGFSNGQNTVDLDFQHHIRAGQRNDIMWGLGGRLINVQYNSGYAVTIVPAHRLDHLLSGFFQDELRLTNSLSFTIGSKLEQNSFTGFEYEPSAQLVWTPTSRQTLWLSAARAIRQPSPIDVGLETDVASVLAGATFGVIETIGNPDIRDEQLREVELGYRVEPAKRVSLDFAGFAGLYRDLESLAPQPAYVAFQNGVPYLVIPEMFVNRDGALTYGAEFFGSWKVTNRWRIGPGYSYFHMNLRGDADTINTVPGVSPDHQFQIRSELDLPHRLEWDSTLEYVDKLPAGDIPAYARLDSRVGWRAGENVELSLVGQNLLSPRHAEFADFYYPVHHTLVERSVFGKVTWRF